MTKYNKKTSYKRECRTCKKWFDSETKSRHVCNKCKSKINWGGLKQRYKQEKRVTLYPNQ